MEKRKRRFGSQAILSGEPKGPKLPKSLLFKYFFAFFMILFACVLSMHPLGPLLTHVSL
jgi:hypothetical protein